MTLTSTPMQVRDARQCRRPPIPFRRAAIEAGAAVVVIQHPSGGAKRVTKGRLRRWDGPRLLYDADTLPGSSGSPVLNEHLTLIGLPHAGRADVRLNEGLSVAAILDCIAAQAASAKAGGKSGGKSGGTPAAVARAAAASPAVAAGGSRWPALTQKREPCKLCSNNAPGIFCNRHSGDGLGGGGSCSWGSATELVVNR